MALDVLLLMITSCNALVDGVQSRAVDDDFIWMDGDLHVAWSRVGIGSKSAARAADTTVE